MSDEQDAILALQERLTREQRAADAESEELSRQAARLRVERDRSRLGLADLALRAKQSTDALLAERDALDVWSDGLTAELRQTRAALVTMTDWQREAVAEAAQLRAERDAASERDDWLRKQLDGLIEDAEAVVVATGLALARSVLGNLRDARAALAPAPEAETT